jgi:uncharacterized protein (TIGR03067 family)
MRLHALLVLAACPVLAAAQSKEGGARKERERLQGTWLLVAREFAGKADSAEDLKRARGKVVIKGDKVVVSFPGEDERRLTFKVDPSARPKRIDLTFLDGDYKGKTALGIYELDRDKLKVCYAPPKVARPTEFSGKIDNDWVLVVYEREKE